MEKNAFYTVADIASDLSISEADAAAVVKKLHRELRRLGKLTIPGKVPAAWYEEQKGGGFMGTGTQAERIPLTERRLLNVQEFREYAGGIGDGTARRVAREIGAVVHIGDRFLVDRARFDEWCSEQRQQAAGQEPPE